MSIATCAFVAFVGTLLGEYLTLSAFLRFVWFGEGNFWTILFGGPK